MKGGRTMKKQTITLVGLGMVLFGLLALLASLFMPTLGMRLMQRGLQRIWPALVVNLGLAMCVLPLLVRHRRGLGGMYIPGVPVLITGTLLFAASVLNWWRIWTWLWPLEVLAVAAGFLAAAAYMRVIWLLIPALVVGANGLLMQFCAITGLWNAWAVMWTIEPLSVGLALLIIGAQKRRRALMAVGLGMSLASGLATMGMLALVPVGAARAGWWLIRAAGPALLIVIGILLVVQGLTRDTAPEQDPESETEPAPYGETTPELNRL